MEVSEFTFSCFSSRSKQNADPLRLLRYLLRWVDDNSLVENGSYINWNPPGFYPPQPTEGTFENCMKMYLSSWPEIQDATWWSNPCDYVEEYGVCSKPI